jgi:hypothetical protein
MQRSAPGLVAWLDNHARDDGTRPLMVRFVPVMFDGRDPPRIVPREFWGKDSIETTEEAALPLEVASGDDPPFIERRSTTWIGRHFGAGVIVLSPLAERRIEFYAIVYSPPGVDERPVRLAFNAAAKSVHKAIILAARGMTSTRIVARQSPCRPRWAHGG